MIINAISLITDRIEKSNTYHDQQDMADLRMSSLQSYIEQQLVAFNSKSSAIHSFKLKSPLSQT